MPPRPLVATGPDVGAAAREAAAALERGELAVLPTDTVYGVAARADDPAAVDRLVRAKGRSRELPLPVLVADAAVVSDLVERVPRAAAALMGAHWPGPVTLVLPRRPDLGWDLGEDEGTIAVRMPLEDVTLRVLRQVGPLAVTAACRPGGPWPLTVEDAREALGDAVSVHVDGGARASGVVSTVVDCTRGRPRVLREGAIAGDEVLAALTEGG